MNISKEELITVLSSFNPWWRNEAISDLKRWRRAAYGELFTWVDAPPVPRAILLSGARQVGKTTLLLQVIDDLLKNGVPAANILYTTFDHPIIKLAGIDTVLAAWRAREPKVSGIEYLFLDEAQFIRDSGTWIKHQVDFNKERRIIFTGSAMPLIHKEQESGVGRWHNIRLTTLSFYEYLQIKQHPYKDIFNSLSKDYFNFEKIKNDSFDYETIFSDEKNQSFRKNYLSKLELENSKTKINFENFLINFFKPPIELSPLPQLKSLQELFNWSQEKFYQISELAIPYVGHFHEYLVRGGFPQTAQIEDINQAQRLLREDIIDKVLKRDMTALFGVRRVLDLEQTFLYLCLHDGGLLDMQNLCSNLEVKRPTAQHFIELLEASHLIYRLQPFGYGKEVLRAKYKVYLADAAIAPAVLLKGKSVIDNPEALGIATETATYKHLLTRYYSQNVRFTYGHGDKNREVDLIAEFDGQIVPFEVKYRAQHTGARELKGLIDFCKKKSIERAYVITKSLDDFGLLKIPNVETRIMRIPAPLLCYWMGEAELTSQNNFSVDV